MLEYFIDLFIGYLKYIKNDKFNYKIFSLKNSLFLCPILP